MLNESIVTNKKYASIDTLRCIAVMLVIFWHSSIFALEVTPPANMLSFLYFNFSIIGASGVTLFFVISGFLITGILLDTSNEKKVLRKFYIRRTLRIFPLYYVSFFFICILSYVLINDFKINGALLSYFFYVPNFFWLFTPEHTSIFSQESTKLFDHFWSLAIEEQFYLIWPILLLILNKRIKPAYTAIIIMSLILLSMSLRVNLVSWQIINWQTAYTFTPLRLDGLLLGALVAFIMHHDMHSYKKLLNIASNYIIFVPIITVFIIYLLIKDINIFYLNVIFIIFVSALFYTLTIWICINKPDLFQNKIYSKASINIARISYGIYIFHYPIMRITQFYLEDAPVGYWHAHIILFIVGFSLSYILSSISFKFLEAPILRLKEKYAPYDKQ